MPPALERLACSADPSRLETIWLLAMTHTLLIRAIVIPSSGLHTVLIGVLGSVPLLVGFEFGSAPEATVLLGSAAWGGLCTAYIAA